MPKTGEGVHIVKVVRFAPRSNDGPLECSCGLEMLASEFKDHRRDVAALRGTAQSDLARDQTYWRRSTPGRTI